MGGPSTGGGGGVGAAGKKKDGTYGTKKDAKKTSSRNEGRKAAKAVGDYIKRGGIVGSVVKGFKEGAKKSKQNVMDYEGQAAGVTPMRAPFDNTDRGGNDNPPSKKSIEQPKVKAQMDNTEVKSKNIIADKTAPTETEMPTEELSEDEKLLRRKRGRKTKTVLTSVTGDNTKATLSKKTLLGY